MTQKQVAAIATRRSDGLTFSNADVSYMEKGAVSEKWVILRSILSNYFRGMVPDIPDICREGDLGATNRPTTKVLEAV
jgi:hypothetical protein